ncbi:MAG: chemotaxis protein CheW [Butyrivibrio sp.]
MQYFQLMVFRLGDEYYGLDITNVHSIEKKQDIVRVPNSSPNIKGIINLRGEIIPVIDLKSKFCMEDKATDIKTDELIIINLTDNRIALAIDGVEKIYNVTSDDIRKMPSIAKGAGVTYFTGVVKLDDKLVILIDPMELLSEEEREAVEKIIDDNSPSDEE